MFAVFLALLAAVAEALALGRVVSSGRSQCRVAAFGACARLMLAIFFITISHCPWRDFISWSTTATKKQKQRKRLSTIGQLVSLACGFRVFGTYLARK